MLPVLGIIATLAIVAGLLLILGTAMPSISNKVCRFVFLFVLFILFDLVIDYVNVWAFGFHDGGWTLALAISLAAAIYGTFLLPPSRNSDTP
jgi:hypothetical protein